MGCCTRFRTTWWPGYSSDVIDPDKAFNFQRRISIIKRVIIGAAIVAFLCGAIYFLFWILSCQSGKSNFSEGTGETNQTLSNSTTEAQKLVGSGNKSVSHEAAIKQNSSQVGGSAPGNVSLGSVMSFGLPSQPKNSSHADEGPESPAVSAKNYTDSATEDLCGPKGSNPDSECIALSKDFKSLTTVENHGVQKNHSSGSRIEGYILVKSNDSSHPLWHPHCIESWDLEFGYKLCHKLGFKQLYQLQTVGITEVQQRVHNTGKDVSLELPRQQNSGNSSSSSNTSDAPTATNKCNIGYISCVSF